MKFLIKPIVNDLDVLDFFDDELFTNKKLRQRQKSTIQQSYFNYSTSKGCPFSVNPIGLPKSISKNFKKRYKKNRHNKLSYISTIRNALSDTCCPMCGYKGTLQVDHFFPQTDYPEFSLFCANLVPSCKCNSIKNQFYKGTPTNERFLHPYYDQILQSRIVLLKFSGFSNQNPVPDLMLEANLPSSSPLYPRVNYHIKKLLAVTDIYDYLGRRWNEMLSNTYNFFLGHWTPGSNKSINDFDLMLNTVIGIHDGNTGSPNNWYSIFLFGIQQDNTIKNFVFQKVK